MPEPKHLNSSGLQCHHLRRIGPPATKTGVADIMDFHRVTYMIGRNPNQVDYVIDSNNFVQSSYISRNHARLVRQQQDNTHRLFDDSLNGIFINNVKISGSVILNEGDLVTFGHPSGMKLPAGIRIRQPESEYQFIFEQCDCAVESRNVNHQMSNENTHMECRRASSRENNDTLSEESNLQSDVALSYPTVPDMLRLNAGKTNIEAQVGNSQQPAEKNFASIHSLKEGLPVKGSQSSTGNNQQRKALRFITVEDGSEYSMPLDREKAEDTLFEPLEMAAKATFEKDESGGERKTPVADIWPPTVVCSNEQNVLHLNCQPMLMNSSKMVADEENSGIAALNRIEAKALEELWNVCPDKSHDTCSLENQKQLIKRERDLHAAGDSFPRRERSKEWNCTVTSRDSHVLDGRNSENGPCVVLRDGFSLEQKQEQNAFAGKMLIDCDIDDGYVDYSCKYLDALKTDKDNNDKNQKHAYLGLENGACWIEKVAAIKCLDPVNSTNIRNKGRLVGGVDAGLSSDRNFKSKQSDVNSEADQYIPEDRDTGVEGNMNHSVEENVSESMRSKEIVCDTNCIIGGLSLDRSTLIQEVGNSKRGGVEVHESKTNSECCEQIERDSYKGHCEQTLGSKIVERNADLEHRLSYESRCENNLAMSKQQSFGLITSQVCLENVETSKSPDAVQVSGSKPPKTAKDASDSSQLALCNYHDLSAGEKSWLSLTVANDAKYFSNLEIEDLEQKGADGSLKNILKSGNMNVSCLKKRKLECVSDSLLQPKQKKFCGKSNAPSLSNVELLVRDFFQSGFSTLQNHGLDSMMSSIAQTMSCDMSNANEINLVTKIELKLERDKLWDSGKAGLSSFPVIRDQVTDSLSALGENESAGIPFGEDLRGKELCYDRSLSEVTDANSIPCDIDRKEYIDLNLLTDNSVTEGCIDKSFAVVADGGSGSGTGLRKKIGENLTTVKPFPKVTMDFEDKETGSEQVILDQSSPLYKQGDLEAEELPGHVASLENSVNKVSPEPMMEMSVIEEMKTQLPVELIIKEQKRSVEDEMISPVGGITVQNEDLKSNIVTDPSPVAVQNSCTLIGDDDFMCGEVAVQEGPLDIPEKEQELNKRDLLEEMARGQVTSEDISKNVSAVEETSNLLTSVSEGVCSLGYSNLSCTLSKVSNDLSTNGELVEQILPAKEDKLRNSTINCGIHQTVSNETKLRESLAVEMMDEMHGEQFSASTECAPCDNYVNSCNEAKNQLLFNSQSPDDESHLLFSQLEFSASAMSSVAERVSIGGQMGSKCAKIITDESLPDSEAEITCDEDDMGLKISDKQLEAVFCDENGPLEAEAEQKAARNDSSGEKEMSRKDAFANKEEEKSESDIKDLAQSSENLSCSSEVMETEEESLHLEYETEDEGLSDRPFDNLAESGKNENECCSVDDDGDKILLSGRKSEYVSALSSTEKCGTSDTYGDGALDEVQSLSVEECKDNDSLSDIEMTEDNADLLYEASEESDASELTRMGHLQGSGSPEYEPNASLYEIEGTEHMENSLDDNMQGSLSSSDMSNKENDGVKGRYKENASECKELAPSFKPSGTPVQGVAHSVKKQTTLHSQISGDAVADCNKARKGAQDISDSVVSVTSADCSMKQSVDCSDSTGFVQRSLELAKQGESNHIEDLGSKSDVEKEKDGCILDYTNSSDLPEDDIETLHDSSQASQNSSIISLQVLPNMISPLHSPFQKNLAASAVSAIHQDGEDPIKAFRSMSKNLLMMKGGAVSLADDKSETKDEDRIWPLEDELPSLGEKKSEDLRRENSWSPTFLLGNGANGNNLCSREDDALPDAKLESDQHDDKQNRKVEMEASKLLIKSCLDDSAEGKSLLADVNSDGKKDLKMNCSKIAGELSRLDGTVMKREADNFGKASCQSSDVVTESKSQSNIGVAFKAIDEKDQHPENLLMFQNTVGSPATVCPKEENCQQENFFQDRNVMTHSNSKIGEVVLTETTKIGLVCSNASENTLDVKEKLSHIIPDQSEKVKSSQTPDFTVDNDSSCPNPNDIFSCTFEDMEYSPPALDFFCLDSDEDNNSFNSNTCERVMSETNEGAMHSSSAGLMSSSRKRKEMDTCSTQMTVKRLKDFTNSCMELDSKKNDEQFLNTQVIDNISDSQLGYITSTLENSAQEMDSKARARQILEKLRAKRKSLQSRRQSDAVCSGVLETPVELSAIASKHVCRKILDEDGAQVTRCAGVIRSLQNVLMSHHQLQCINRVQTWLKELDKLNKKMQLPSTIIAVVGDTGAGKSSLLNALLDHGNILPTSGMRACTAVVVEVQDNVKNNNYEADIEFLSQQEWEEELELLYEDLTADGKVIPSRQPDPKSEAGIAYSKIKAVYGKVGKIEKLKDSSSPVTSWLGKVKPIEASKAEDLKPIIDRYIESSDKGCGGQFWPVVKSVKIRIPKCDVLSSGATLVDLPGVRDSNAARDKIAKEYLKNCTAVWVVASIHRAVDDRTAKDLLGESFRRQLLMDGQYGSIAFICTKSDILTSSEIIRSLDLGETCEVLEEEIRTLEKERKEINGEITAGTSETRELKKEIKTMQSELDEMKEEITEYQELLDKTDSSEGEQELKELSTLISDKEKAIKEKESELEQKEVEIKKLDGKILKVDHKLAEGRKKVSAICAKARNDYSRSQISKDFKAGLQEMKRRAGLGEDDKESGGMEGPKSKENDLEKYVDDLKVYCVSSIEYLKLNKLLPNDGPAQVFSHENETQVPSLKAYVHEITVVKRKLGMKRLIQNLGQFVFDLEGYIMDGGTECQGTRLGVKSAVEECLQQLKCEVDPTLDTLAVDIRVLFDNHLSPQVSEGTKSARDCANQISSRWSMPVNKEDRNKGGFHHSTYIATVRRNGSFKSPTCGYIDFNEQLTEPVFSSLSIHWSNVFGLLLWKIIEKCQKSILSKIQQFMMDLSQKLQSLDVAADRIQRVNVQLLAGLTNKFREIISQLKEIVTEQQREISRLMAPYVQEMMATVYSACSSEQGHGMFMRVKAVMAAGIETNRTFMFDQASQILIEQLMNLQATVVEHVRMACQLLYKDIRMAYEPLWEMPSNSRLLQDALLEGIKEACVQVRTLFADVGLPFPETRSQFRQQQQQRAPHKPQLPVLAHPQQQQFTMLTPKVEKMSPPAAGGSSNSPLFLRHNPNTWGYNPACYNPGAGMLRKSQTAPASACPPVPSSAVSSAVRSHPAAPYTSVLSGYPVSAQPVISVKKEMTHFDSSYGLPNSHPRQYFNEPSFSGGYTHIKPTCSTYTNTNVHGMPAASSGGGMSVKREPVDNMYGYHSSGPLRSLQALTAQVPSSSGRNFTPQNPDFMDHRQAPYRNLQSSSTVVFPKQSDYVSHQNAIAYRNLLQQQQTSPFSSCNIPSQSPSHRSNCGMPLPHAASLPSCNIPPPHTSPLSGCNMSLQYSSCTTLPRHTSPLSVCSVPSQHTSSHPTVSMPMQHASPHPTGSMPMHHVSPRSGSSVPMQHTTLHPSPNVPHHAPPHANLTMQHVSLHSGSNLPSQHTPQHPGSIVPSEFSSSKVSSHQQPQLSGRNVPPLHHNTQQQSNCGGPYGQDQSGTRLRNMLSLTAQATEKSGPLQNSFMEQSPAHLKHLLEVSGTTSSKILPAKQTDSPKQCASPLKSLQVLTDQVPSHSTTSVIRPVRIKQEFCHNPLSPGQSGTSIPSSSPSVMVPSLQDGQKLLREYHPDRRRKYLNVFISKLY